MSTEAASTANNNASSLHRPPRGGSGSSRFNTSRGGPRRGAATATRGTSAAAAAATAKSTPTEDWSAAQEDPSDTSEEVAQLKVKYVSQLKVLKDIFPDWTAENLVFALQEVDGDITLASDRIAGGTPPVGKISW